MNGSHPFHAEKRKTNHWKISSVSTIRYGLQWAAYYSKALTSSPSKPHESFRMQGLWLVKSKEEMLILSFRSSPPEEEREQEVVARVAGFRG